MRAEDPWEQRQALAQEAPLPEWPPRPAHPPACLEQSLHRGLGTSRAHTSTWDVQPQAQESKLFLQLVCGAFLQLLQETARAPQGERKPSLPSSRPGQGS